MVNTPRFHCSMPLAPGRVVDLPESVAHHASRVLRLRSGDALTLFNGDGGEYTARILDIERTRVSAEILQWLDCERESTLAVTLVQALQAGEKMDSTIQKAVELGVRRIVPVVSRRSVLRLDGERALRRLQHWRGVIAAACEQCGRNRLPEIVAPEGLDRWFTRPAEARVVRLMLAPTAERGLVTLPGVSSGGAVELLIGAEGGLAAEERELAELTGFIPVRLGPRILRTETAGLAALAAIQLLWGDFKEETTNV